jgi:hypothetical protein
MTFTFAGMRTPKRRVGVAKISASSLEPRTSAGSYPSEQYRELWPLRRFVELRFLEVPRPSAMAAHFPGRAGLRITRKTRSVTLPKGAELRP